MLTDAKRKRNRSLNMDNTLRTFTSHLDTLDYSPLTRKHYVDGLKDYHAHGFEEITIENELAYKAMLIAEGKKGTTVNARIHAMNAYNRWIGLPPIKTIRTNEEPFAVNGMELDDYHNLLDHLLADEKYHWYLAVKLLASTGMRIGEAVQITYGDFRKGSCLVYGKGRKPRIIYFSHSLKETLWLFIKGKPDNERMIPYDPHYVREAFRRFKKRYNITCAASPHEFRRLFSREMYESTKDAALVKGLLGHENLKTTYKYIKPTQQAAMRQYAKVQNW